MSFSAADISPEASTTGMNVVSDGNSNRENIEQTSQSHYNLRQRKNPVSVEPSSSPAPPSSLSDSGNSNSNVPYKVVEDPEVPDLADFLASQEAAKVKEKNLRAQNNKTTVLVKGGWTEAQCIEAFKIGGCFVTALLAKFSGKLDFIFLFQVSFDI